MISEKIFNTNGTIKIFTSDFEIFSDSHIKVYLDDNEVTFDNFDIINNSVVFNTAPISGQQLKILVSTTPDEFIDVGELNNVNVRNIANIEVLKTSNVTHNNVYVSGYYEKNDGGQGLFYWDETSTETENGGTIIANDNETTGRYKRIIENDTINVKQFGSYGDGVNDDTEMIQAAIDTGYKVFLPEGTFMISSLIIYTGTIIEGLKQEKSILKQIAETNADMIKSYNYDTEDIKNISLIKFGLNGNYFNGNWNDSSNTYNNTIGNGLNLKVYSCEIDLGINNIAGIGALFEEPNANENSSEYHIQSKVSISGRDFGKEGIIIKGPNDWILDTAFIGRAGILKRPEAETMRATSSYYIGERVSGIVIDGANIEINEIHSYACWSGSGFETKNNVRLTKGGRIIAESNNNQVTLSSGTYGSANIDIRNLSLIHPNWTGSIPAYSGSTSEWDGVYIDADDFTCDITVKRTITASTRVVGTNAVTINNSPKVSITYSNSNAPVGDSEYGSLYSGDVCEINGKGANVDIIAQSVNGNAVKVLGEGNRINLSVKDSIVALVRDSVGNSMRGNNISGSIVNCYTGFNSIGTPTSEIINLSMELDTGEIPFIGNRPDVARGQIWNISASVANNDKSTRKFLVGYISNSVTTEQTLTIPHEYLYTPDFMDVQYSVDDRATTGHLEYLYLNDITSTDLIFKYRLSVAGDNADNQRVNVRIG